MKVVWDNLGLGISSYVPLGKKIEGIKKIKVNEKCLADSELIMTDASHDLITIK